MEEFVSNINEPNLISVFDVWHSKCLMGMPPFRSDFNMDQISYVHWKNLSLYELTDDQRLIGIHNGTNVVSQFNSEGTGKYLDDLTAFRDSDIASKIYMECLNTGCPIYFHANSEPFEDEYSPFARLLLPLRGSDEDNRFILGITEFFDRKKIERTTIEKEYWNIIRVSGKN